MTELYLQKDGTTAWQQLWPDTAQSIKLTRENPYFTQSESYTLDVTLPMDILQNRSFFQNIQRMERSKQPQHMKCRLVVDNHPVLTGTARVTQVTQESVKVQLLGGNSEANLKGGQLYIDEMDMGVNEVSPLQPAGYDNYNAAGVRFVCMQAWDETKGEVANQKTVFWESTQQGTTRHPMTSHLEGSAPQPNLLDVLMRVIEQMGYTPGSIFPWQEPWKNLYVASAKATRQLAHALPHWTAKEFLDELCQLFNCTLKVDPVAMTIGMESNIAFFGNAQTKELAPCNEYTADVADDNDDSEAQSLANANIGYALSSSSAHDYDCLTEAIRGNAPRLTYENSLLLALAYSAMDAAVRRRYIFECPEGKFVDWRDEDGGVSQLVAVDILAPLMRNNAGENSLREMKIVPVAITEDAKGKFVWQVNNVTNVYGIAFRSLSLENPTGDELETIDGGTGADIQDLITGEAEIEKKAEKEDLMQVFFVEDVEQTATAYIDDEDESRNFTALMPMTDYRYKVKGDNHRRWSLSLNPTDADYYLGQLHVNGFSFNVKAKHVFRFLADRMPDPRDIFIVRGKRYGCEKIEANVNADGFDKLMTGYFYEML
ncbi:MAG: hypothetical protein IKR50_01820 [Prevotella sp.]|nr:hypothetical protein [Prevotella sp.]